MGTAEPGQAIDEYERLFRQAAPVLWRTIYAYAGGRKHVADDAVAESFARALEHRATIRDPLPWIYRTAFRLARADMKLEARQGGAPPEQPAGVEEDLRDLISALRSLSPGQRAAIVLHYHVDLPVREVSRLMDTSVSVVKVHLYRGRRRLRALLGSEEA